jgi:hypothetical protein
MVTTPPRPPRRERIKDRSVFLRGPENLEFLHTLLAKLPFDDENPVEVLMREQVKKRQDRLNQAMWAGTLRDIERQAHFPHPNGPTYPAAVWHEHLKELFLPDENLPDFDPSLVLDGYHKWDFDPFNGQRRLHGSTTHLTDRGMRLYVLQVEAHMASEYAVTFTVPEDERRG